MKTRKRTVPLDMLSVEQGDRRISINTHRQIIGLYAGGRNDLPAQHTLTFDQLFTLLCELKPGIAELVTK